MYLGCTSHAICADSSVRAGLGPWDPKSGLSVSIPGAAALWEDIQVKYGKLTLTQALAPAIHMAREGYPVGPVAANQWAGDKVRGEEASRVLFPGGKPPKAGQIFKNPDLARTFEELAEKGSKKGFYSGRIAEAIVAATKEFDGVLELEDLARHETTYYDPISVVYKGIRIYETPPPTHGLAALIALKLLEELEKSDGKGGEAEIATPAELSFTDDFRGVRSEVQNIHDSIEAMRIAYTEVLHHCADPLHCDVDSAAALLSDKYIQQRVKDIDRSKASVMFPTDDLKPFANGDTVYFSAVDKYGNACSMINSNYMGFGTGKLCNTHFVGFKHYIHFFRNHAERNRLHSAESCLQFIFETWSQQPSCAQQEAVPHNYSSSSCVRKDW